MDYYFWDTNYYIENSKDSRFVLCDTKKHFMSRIYRLINPTKEVFESLVQDYDLMFKSNSEFGILIWVDARGRKFSQR